MYDDLAKYFEIEYKEEAFFNQLNMDIVTKKLSLVDKKLNDCLEQYVDAKDIIYFMFARLFFDTDKKKAMQYLEESLNSKKVYFSYEKIFDLYVQMGCLKKALSVLPQTKLDDKFQRKVTVVEENCELLEKSFPQLYDEIRPLKNVNYKILYFVYNSLPYHSKGYALRTQGIMTAVNRCSSAQFTVEAVSRLAYPHDIVKDLDSTKIISKETVNSQIYHRLPSDIRKSNVSYLLYIQEYAKAIIELAKKEKPFLLHTCSNFSHALGVINAAKYLGVPSIYEIRGLWEVTAISNNPVLVGSDSYKLQAHLETEAALQADIVITITEALKKEMVRRGVPVNKITVIPNAVDTNSLKPLDKNLKLINKYNLHDKVVIGYIGSFVEYEGLDDLISVIQKLIIERKLVNFIVLLVGSGIKLQSLHEKVSALNLSSYFIFTGEVEHKYIQD